MNLGMRTNYVKQVLAKSPVQTFSLVGKIKYQLYLLTLPKGDFQSPWQL